MSKYKGNHRTIYADKETWELIQAEAKKQGRSVSNYLVNLHNASLVCRDLGFTPEKLPFKELVVSDDIGTIGADLKKPDPIQKAASDLEKLKKSKKFRPEADASSGGQDFFNPMPKVGKKSKGGA